MTPEQAAALRAPFPKEQIGKIPRAGTTLDYVGHAAVTDRLLSVDPMWTWEPAAFDEIGAPLITQRGTDSVMWIHLTVWGVTRFGVGIVATKSFELEKQLISDAIRNAAMRFGVALDLWSKEDLNAAPAHADGHDADRLAEGVGSTDSAPSATTRNKGNKVRRDRLKTKCVALQADGVSVADAREALGLPLVDSCDDEQLTRFEAMVSDLEAALEAPFEKASA